MSSNVEEKVRTARRASVVLASVKTEKKNSALERMAEALDRGRDRILRANNEDLLAAKQMVEREEIKPSLLQRLEITDYKIDQMIDGILDVRDLPDPLGKVTRAIELDDGLDLYQVTSPIGLIGVIFESRPDVIPQIMSLCLKTGNATIFKGGSEAARSNRILFDVLVEAIESVPGIPKGAFQLMETRQEVDSILAMDGYIDLLIPRGSNQFVRYIQENTRIPVLGHTSGICHAYVDAEADIDVAKKVVLDSKIQYPAACNAIETLLVHSAIAEKFLPEVTELFVRAGVELRCDDWSREFLSQKGFGEKIKEATEEDWETEYNDLIISVKMVDSIDEAIEHINLYGSHHTDTIITKSPDSMRKFQALVDSSSVMINCSTRFADGYRYGKGAEIGISTLKVHARGPVGMEGLLIYKYVLIGRGQIVAEYSGKGAKPFTHRPIELRFPLADRDD